jgi:negative regulator of sigma E activity
MPRCRRAASGARTKEIMMNKTHERYTVIDDVAGAGAAAQAVRAPSRYAAWLAVFFAIAVGMSAWLAVSKGVTDVSAAAADAQSTPQVPYFPSLYVNQATAVEPAPPTF